MKILRFLLTISLLVGPLTAQDQAERLYDNARTFLNAGKIEEAVTDFQNVIDNFADSPFAPKALLALGVHRLETENDHGRALPFFQKIQDSYGTSTEAPAAYYYKALIMERHGATREELERAVADLIRMNNLFPDNPWRGEALFLFGKLQLRLGDDDQALSFFQRLEFSYPSSPRLQEALFLSARAAYRKGRVQRAETILARLQAKYPNKPIAARAAAWLRLLARFSETALSYETDRTFFGGTPKRFNSPQAILVTPDDRIAILENRSVQVVPLSGGSSAAYSDNDLSEFALDNDGRLLLVYKNRIVSESGEVATGGLSADGKNLRGIRSAAIDDFGRLFVIDSGERDLLAFDENGAMLGSFSLERPRLVRTMDARIWVLDGDGDTLKAFGDDLQPVRHPIPSLDNIEDFRFDVFGNLYVLYERGSRVSVFDPNGGLRFNVDLKATSNFPLKQAQAIAVDAAGAIYLSDRRGGAVFRFH